MCNENIFKPSENVRSNLRVFDKVVGGKGDVTCDGGKSRPKVRV